MLGTKQYVPPSSLVSACVPEGATDRSTLSAILSELDSHIQTAGALAERLHVAMDYVAGSVPSDTSAGNTCAPTAAGIIASAQERLSTLCRLLDRVDDGVRRLERVIC